MEMVNGAVPEENTNNGGDKDANSVNLKKELGLHNAVGMIVGVIVGSGIFVSPKGVLLEAGSVGISIIVWGACGVVSLIGAMCYAELGTCILKSGGDYAYIMESIGHLPAFLYLWVALVVIIPTGNAITALTFANYVLQPIYPDCDAPGIAVTLLAALCVTLLTFINMANVKWAVRVQDFFTFAKIVALVMIIVTGLVKICQGDIEDSFEAPFENSQTELGKVALAFYSGLFSYSGWNYLNFVTEELKDPYKNLPRAIWISIPLITIIYVLANIAYFAVITPQEMLASNAVAVVFANRTYGVMAWIMPLFVAFSTFGGVNGAIFTSARLVFVGARQGHLPGILATINIRRYTPMPSLLFGCVMTLIMLSSRDVYTLINYTSFVTSGFIGVSIAGMLYLRYSRPTMERPIKVSIVFPVFFMMICLFLIIMPLTSNPMECFVGIIMVVTGIPVYLIGVVWESKPKWFRDILEQCTVLTQKACLSLQEELKEK
ncbi:hypothetical protein ACJMK2_010240 [Sinanodonta woodiana]|uniref:Large neutral amino acids transporter small subunit 2 n=1 Tax=Sinanodonta woodiana TaxID=1069815 RepID=A0ABD3VEQ1_SINWO